MPVPIDEAALTLGTADGNYYDVDVTSSLGSDAGSCCGVLLHVWNENAVEKHWSVRKNGGTDNIYSDMEDTGHTFVAIGIDSGDILEFARESTDVKAAIIGYITDAEGVFLTNSDDVTQMWAAWSDNDLSAEITSDDPGIVAFFLTKAHYTFKYSGMRENGSTDTRTADLFPNDLRGSMMTLDANEIFEQIDETQANGTREYLLGWLTTNATSFANAKDYSENSTTGSFVDVDMSSDVPSGNTGVFFHMHSSDGSEYKHGIQQNGGSPAGEYHDISVHQYGWYEVDSNRIFEQKIENTAEDLWIFGYTSEPGAEPAVRRIFITHS